MRTKVNPYIGPRVFQRDEGHLFFGRTREASDLIGLVISEQLLLFYAQSGAGKSSLINARIIPELAGSDFEVLPVGRVSGNRPYDVKPQNIYLYNLERSLIQHDVNEETLSTLSLTSFLKGLDHDQAGYFFSENLLTKPTEEDGDDDEPRRRVLIIDQFEEFFSTHPEAWAQREGFFRELAQAMKDHPALSIVLVMREDFVASLDPYAHLLPGGMRRRYYMQRLSRETALAAIKNPVADLRPYAAGVAERLVDDLCSIKVQAPDGSLDIAPGQFVESVQLQVVCHNLWEFLSPGGNEITAMDLQDVGDVNSSLGRYYAERVGRVAAEKNVKERKIRDWFEYELITPGGMRNIVLREPGKTSGGLTDDVIVSFMSDLVRAEKRGGATFYELTHDRLVEPVLADNARWRSEHTRPLQRQADLWMDQGQNDNWLLSGEALTELERWAQVNPDELTDSEQQFLEASRKQQSSLNMQAERMQHEKNVYPLYLITAIGMSIIMIALSYSVITTGGNPGTIIFALLTIGSLILGYLIGRYRRR